MKQFDERDSMFSRVGLIPGTRKYRDYYDSHPELRAGDDRIRASSTTMLARIYGVEPGRLPGAQKFMAFVQKLMDVVSAVKMGKIRMDAADMPIPYGSGTDDEIARSPIALSRPALISARAMNRAAEAQPVHRRKVRTDPGESSAFLKELAIAYGADAVGIARIETHHHYSHRGDMFGMGVGYGNRLRPSYPHGIVVASALNPDMIQRAPRSDVWVASMLGSSRCTAVTAQLALYIKSLGYQARTDNFFEYLSPLTPLAAAAGIGQVGRCNLVVHREYGNRLKIGAVLTDLPLVEDGPVDLGMTEYCRTCDRCARSCPAGAISFTEPEIFNGILQWRHDGARCMETWMRMGTGCGICMASCPFSQGVDPGLIRTLKKNPTEAWGLQPCCPGDQPPHSGQDGKISALDISCTDKPDHLDTY